MIIKCRDTGNDFTLTSGELAVYDKLGAPVPTLCPDERARRRLAWRNERRLQRRTCSGTGKSILSIFDSTVPFPVYAQEYWWSDRWDFRAYGRDFDFTRPFFEQFLALFQVVPQVALNAPGSENSEYTNQCTNNKDCYLCFCCSFSRDCLYGMWNSKCEECVDCSYVERCELCYQVLNARNSYGCAFSENMQQCTNCRYCRDLIGCSDCIGCVGLRQKQYCLFNEPVGKERFEEFVRQAQIHTRTGSNLLGVQFDQFEKTNPRKYYQGSTNDGCTGDYLEHCHSVQSSYNCRHSEHLSHGRDAWQARHCVDLLETLDQEFCLNLEGSYKNTYSGFSAKINESGNIWYSSHIHSSSDLFGCVGVRQGKYCILNKEYSEKDYFDLRARIVEHMKVTQEWGEYFPIECSPFAYNESVAQEYFPLSREEVLARGLRWTDKIDKTSEVISQSPDNLFDASDAVLGQTFACERTGRPFKYQKQEYLFYRKQLLPLPTIHPEIRYYERMGKRNRRTLRKGECAECRAPFETTFPSDTCYRLLCERCYSVA